MSARSISLLALLLSLAVPQALRAESGLVFALGGGYNDHERISGAALQGALGYRTGPWLAQATFADLTYRTDLPSQAATGPVAMRAVTQGYDFGPTPGLPDRVEYATLIDLSYVIPNNRVFLGAGHRFSSSAEHWYASGGFFLGDPGQARPAFRLNVGDDYVAAQMTLLLELTD